MVERVFKVNDAVMVTHCPICIHIVKFYRENEQWKQGMCCCHLKYIEHKDDKYIGNFVYKLGEFEGIKICH